MLLVALRPSLVHLTTSVGVPNGHQTFLHLLFHLNETALGIMKKLATAPGLNLNLKLVPLQPLALDTKKEAFHRPPMEPKRNHHMKELCM